MKKVNTCTFLCFLFVDWCKYQGPGHGDPDLCIQQRGAADTEAEPHGRPHHHCHGRDDPGQCQGQVKVKG